MRSITTFAALAAAVAVLTPAAAIGSPGRGGARGSLTYTSPANILRGQRALESLGRLERGKYSPGEYDETTRWAIRTYQRRYGLVATGSFDFDTFAMLPIDERPDADDDGVPDADDRCPSTPKEGPKKTWVRVGHDGCPVETKSS
ncbi:MAG TPA: peptidoglycan-binding domain-containing protein [Dongiaceae bacterium]|nr:peptidoglycan-binding domain-containing protein [Dongiaceae bacterium]